VRRSLLILAGILLAPALWAGEPAAITEPVRMTVYKSPTCGCCAKWVQYLEERNFDVTVVDLANLQTVKGQLGVAPRLQACHTAVVDGYAIEGHVPAEDILKLLGEKPAVAGLAVPGMPTNSPGMLSIEPRGYDVLTFTRSGEITTFSSY
jgi:hypothetical protein